jgi:hypothetical protein
MSTKSKTLTLTVQEVLELVPRLGIPHFQRGLVWGDESVAALLESLFYETPCGSFVLWSPKECASMGVPLDEAVCSELQYLVIDGQQRIRSLHSVFNGRRQSEDDLVEAGGQADSERDLPRVWCINLPRVPGYTALLERQSREFALFVCTVDPAQRTPERQPSPLKHNVLPLKAVEAAEDWFSPSLTRYRDLIRLGEAKSLTAEEGNRRLSNLYQGLRQAVVGMKAQTFFVSKQYKDDPAEMASLFNRINAGGKRVETEERAFARLVGLQPTTYGELKKLFDLVHPKRSSEGRSVETISKSSRDNVLQRQKERAFGFKLFIRVFLQVCQHHLGLQQNRSDFSFELANKASFLESFGKLTEQQVGQLWEETSSAVQHVRSVLRDELACDDLRSLPETLALTPLFQLIIGYPELRGDRYRKLLASLGLRLVLAELDSRTVQRLVQEAGDPSRVAFDVIAQLLKTLDGRVTKSQLSSHLQQANSIQNRYVLLLYWLERRLEARDFLYRNLPKPNLLTRPERLVEEAAKPEKQHLLPFKKAQALYPGELHRGASHAVNSVGNLTYISEDENSFQKGLGDAFANLAAEPKENMRAHLLLDEQAGERVLKDYERLRTRLTAENEAGQAGSVGVFERMIRRRREIILVGLQQWLVTLDRKACESLEIAKLEELAVLAQRDDRLEQEGPMFPQFGALHLAYVIRRMGYPNAEEDRVIALSRRAKPKPAWEHGQPPYSLQLTKRKKIWITLQPPAEVWLWFDSKVPMAVRDQVFEALGIAPVEGARIRLKPVPDFATLLDRMPGIEQQLAASPQA